MEKKIRTLLATALIAAMCFSFAACGSTTGAPADGKKPDANNNSTAQTASPEFVYATDYLEISSETSRSINPRIYTDDGFYCTIDEIVGKDIPEGAVEEFEGQYDVYGTSLYFVDKKGTMTKLDGFSTIETGDPQDGHERYSYNVTLMEYDGSLYSIDSVSDSWNDAPEGVAEYSDEWYSYYKYEETYFLRQLDETGAEMSRVELSLGDGDSDFYFYNAIMDDSGNIILGSENKIYLLNRDGQLLSTLEGNSQYYESLIKLDDGRICATTYNNGYSLQTVDMEAKTFGETIAMPENAYSAIAGGGDYDLYYNNGIAFFGYDIETKENTMLFNWINCDINPDNLSQTINIAEDGTISAVMNTWDSDYINCTNELVTVSLKPYDSVPHKEAITLATQSLGWEERDGIIKFNRSNDKYRINVIDYSEYNTEDDYTAGATKLTTEILAGNVPDIIDLNGMPAEQLAAKGLLSDLYPYIDADSEISREDFFPNVLSALEYNGQLYSTCAQFYITTVCGAAQVVGNNLGWNYDQLLDALATMPEGCDIFSCYITRADVLTACLQLDLDSFVNWDTGECSFDSGAFADMLEFASQFPEEYNWEEYDENSDDYARVQQGKQMLMNAYISSFDDLDYYEYLFGGDMTYIGYPTDSGTGSLLNTVSGYAMSSKTANKDAVWAFLRTFFTEDYQKARYNFPTNIKVYNEKLEAAMTPEYEKDKDGNYLLDADGNRIEMSRGGMSVGNGDVVEFHALSQQQADKLYELITTTTKVATTDNAITQIVLEEAKAFFAGQKSAEDVAKLVQSKASIYVNEQR